ncbi:MAG: peptidylprolyl isomerase [Nitrospirota bacterium]|nr:peptidylprolyl isomerase [Nitrospirota bacterium]
MKQYLVICLSVAALAAGCSKSPMDNAPAKSGPVLAEVGSSKITVDDFKRQQGELPEYARGGFSGDKGNRDFLDYLVIQELFYQEALKKGVDKQAEIRAKIDDMTRKVVLDTYLRGEIEKQAQVTEADAKAYFDGHPDEFKGQEEIKASHILVKSEEQANEVLAKIKKGEAFDKLAKKFSQDPGSRNNGGDLGYFRKGQMVPEFEAAVVNAKTGEVSGPIKTQYGFHIIKVVDRRVGPNLEFEKIAPQLRINLARKKQKEIFDARVAELKKTAKITINEKEVTALPTGEASPHGLPAEKQ